MTTPSLRPDAIWARRKRRLQAYGQWQPPKVPNTAAVAHIHALTRKGMSLRSIGAVAGIPEVTLARIVYPAHNQHSPLMLRETEAAILAVTFDLDAIPGNRQVAVIGTQRRIRALARIGWSAKDVAARLDLSPSLLATWMERDRKRITVATARAVRDVYDELSMRTGPSDRARNWATSRGWAPPLAWDDEAIDDPDATPHGIPTDGPKRHGDGVLNADTLEDLAAWGYTTQQVADRLKVSRNYVDIGITRHAPHLRETFSRNAITQKEITA